MSDFELSFDCICIFVFVFVLIRIVFYVEEIVFNDLLGGDIEWMILNDYLN